ncbi:MULTISPECIES: deoxyribodipyrimidine photo-lyase [unclassified Rhizobium]|jgi:deoxyribodipyrimidine photo-lyase|uniref:cryptochrome/photolyase family protein n=1 Tax=unclassified Rhizobium TaxID=2613769 RepID=UPI000645B1DC|nr:MULTISPECIES: deoxyribodipyrimidine photo-lyase [unclassified Rhizobium]MBN8954107.1 deoxyribodipyrimidine photo-lyase [Rhizobium tropici]OJY75886.1 MAG: deoxyribodipyrimidine photolyase [Rhizobium sp. 60-20]RKD52362.1 deoxyribodipyrimidine photo-lyase type I [Rhizobium sp. WW_1]
MTISKEEPNPILLWFRKDLRLDDNHALQAAATSGRPVIPVYIREPDARECGPLGGAQEWWLHHSLAALQKALGALDSQLILRPGDALTVLEELLAETGAEAVVWNRRYDPAGIAVDTEVKKALRDSGIEANSFAGQLLHEPTRLRTGAGGHYKTYTPFWRAFEQSSEPPFPIEAPEKLLAPSHWPKSDTLTSWSLLPTKPNWATGFPDMWTPGEAAALEKLQDFIDGALDGYADGRDFPNRPATSLLSPHLALGEISPSRIWHATRGLPDNIATDNVVRFRKEIVWREFCYHQLFHFPKLRTANWNDRYDDFPWRSDAKLLKSWQRGQTGYPIVDAGMRQLWRHGWMHNRVRMITASFLIKDLLIDWREGEAWFRDTLVDADPAANTANWQWVAGSGADASPFFRIFNPVLQGEKFDPDGGYIRTFVPELADLDCKYIHRPFEAPDDVLKRVGIELGKHYPSPIVDHAIARQRALAAHASLKHEE